MALNRKHTKEEIEKIRNKMMGRTHTEETKNKISNSCKEWANNHPLAMEERINRLINYQMEARDIVKKYKNGELIEK